MPTNQVLASFPSADFRRFGPHLRIREVSRGEILIPQLSRVREVYFPLSALLTNAFTTEEGRPVETYMIGAEGAAGLAPALARQPAGWSVIVKVAGAVSVLPSDILYEVAEGSAELRAQVRGLAHDREARAMRALACAMSHPAAARLATFILSMAERYGKQAFIFTQEEVAASLNVQRTTVTAGATDLKARRAIEYSRGRISVLDLALLRRMACNCHQWDAAVPFADDPRQCRRGDGPSE